VTSDAALLELDRLRVALAMVQVDLLVTLPERSGLQILMVPEDRGEQYDVVAFVADTGGIYWGGDQPLEGPTSRVALFSVAEGVQDFWAEVHWVVWPVCPRHHHGVHVRPQGQGAHWDPDGLGTVPEADPAWWCRGDGGHDLALVGELAGKRSGS